MKLEIVKPEIGPPCPIDRPWGDSGYCMCGRQLGSHDWQLDKVFDMLERNPY